MFLLFGTGSDYEDKENGRIIRAVCPTCSTETQFVEQIRREYIHLFGVPVLGAEDDDAPKDIFRCTGCRNCYTVLSKEDAARRKMDARFEEQRKEEEKRHRDEQIERELAEMKKKLGNEEKK